MLVYLLLGIVLLCAGADGQRVINGNEAELGEFPYVGALLLYTKDYRCLLTSSIISVDWIITSFSTCFLDLVPGKPRTFFYGVVRFNYYEKYNKNYPQCELRDVVKVNRTYPVLGKTATPIVLGPHVQVGKILRHTPFGFIKAGHGKVPGFGLQVNLDGNRTLTYGVIKCSYYCRHVLDGATVAEYSDLRYVCPSGEQFSPGIGGDSGAPLLLSDDGKHFYIGGVLYYWKPSHYTIQGTIMVFVRTSEYLQWIRDHLPV